MKFDVIISNPPYNKDVYLDFVKASFDLLNEDGIGVFITPAKFYAKGGAKNEQFRTKIMPHMKEIHVFKDSNDVFEIGESAGIAYYSVYRSQTFSTKLITNHCKSNAVWEDTTDSIKQHTENPVQFMPISCWNIIDKVKHIAGKMLFENQNLRTNVFCKGTESGHSSALPNDVELIRYAGGTGEQLVAYLHMNELNTTENLDKYKVIINSQLGSGGGIHGNLFDADNLISSVKYCKYIKPNQVNKGSYTNLAYFDTEIEAASYASYFNSQLVYFTVMNSLVGNGSSNNEQWRNTPALPTGYKFDHIYTNEEIFDIFQLTPEERLLITNLIKPRAKK